LAWQYLREAWEPELGEAAWARLARDAGAPSEARLDPFGETAPEPFARALALLDERAGRGDGALQREAGRRIALAWGQTYRSLARRVQGDPRRMLAIAAEEVLPWLLGPGCAAVADAGPASVLLRVEAPLPDAFLQGLLAGFAEVAGAPDARVAREGARFAVAWERAARPSRLAAVEVARWPYLAAALLPALVGGALAAREGFVAIPEWILTLVGVALLQLGALAANDYFDHRSAADEANFTPTRFSGGSRLIQRGVLAPRAVLALAVGCLAAGGVLGLGIALTLQSAHGAGLLQVLGLGAAGVAIAVLYTAPPVRLAHRGLGELAVGLGFGPLVVAGSYLVPRIAAGGGAVLSAEALAFSVPIGALVAAWLTINEIPDAPWDARVGKRTLAVRLGPRAVGAYALLLALAYASLALAAVAFQAWLVLLALLPAPLALRTLHLLRAHRAQPYQLLPANATALLLTLGTGLLLLGGLLLGARGP
jgi:1,4-dihydroxy-2-naphthoate octaprenyltransferase